MASKRIFEHAQHDHINTSCSSLHKLRVVHVDILDKDYLFHFHCHMLSYEDVLTEQSEHLHYSDENKTKTECH